MVEWFKFNISLSLQLVDKDIPLLPPSKGEFYPPFECGERHSGQFNELIS